MGGGSEVITLDNINDATSLYACKAPPTLEKVENTATDSSPASENSGSECKNDCSTDMEESD